MGKRTGLPFIAVMLGFASAGATLDAQDRLPRVSVGIGVGSATNDDTDRMGLLVFPDHGSSVWTVDGDVAVSQRIAVGAEYGSVPTVSNSDHFIPTVVESGTQRERTLVAVTRIRAVPFARGAIDAVAGGGVLLQHYERTLTLCQPTCPPALNQSIDRQSLMFVMGADGPIAIAPHVWLVPFVRLHMLRREDDANVQGPWQFQSSPSTRMTAGVRARVGW